MLKTRCTQTTLPRCRFKTQREQRNTASTTKPNCSVSYNTTKWQQVNVQKVKCFGCKLGRESEGTNLLETETQLRTWTTACACVWALWTKPVFPLRFPPSGRYYNCIVLFVYARVFQFIDSLIKLFLNYKIYRNLQIFKHLPQFQQWLPRRPRTTS